VPCYASDICDKVRGLRHKQETVTRLLQAMCDNEMVVKVNEKYILKEKMTSDTGLFVNDIIIAKLSVKKEGTMYMKKYQNITPFIQFPVYF
jgi:hypothetical protein